MQKSDFLVTVQAVLDKNAKSAEVDVKLIFEEHF